jgi:hypothetical protein
MILKTTFIFGRGHRSPKYCSRFSRSPSLLPRKVLASAHPNLLLPVPELLQERPHQCRASTELLRPSFPSCIIWQYMTRTYCIVIFQKKNSELSQFQQGFTFLSFWFSLEIKHMYIYTEYGHEQRCWPNVEASPFSDAFPPGFTPGSQLRTATSEARDWMPSFGVKEIW